MALQKSKTLNNGATGNYWKITRVILDRKTGSAQFQIELFMDQAHSNVPSLGCSKIFSFTLTQQEATENLTELGYVKIKAEANIVKKAAVEHQAAVAEILADPEAVPPIEYQAPVAEVLASPVVYMDSDIQGALDV